MPRHNTLPKRLSDTTVSQDHGHLPFSPRVSFPGFMLEPWNGLGTNEVAAVDSWIAVRGDFISKEEREGRSGGGGGAWGGGYDSEARGEAGEKVKRGGQK